MKNLIFLGVLLASSLMSEELKIKAASFQADEKKGISVFQGKVNIVFGDDELNADKVTVYTDKKNQPTKFIAEGDAFFSIVTKEGIPYEGKSGKAVYIPNKKEYYFYHNVHLKQIDEKKEIIGEEVILKTIEGKAYAKGAETEPVIMIFDMPKDDKEEKKEKEEKK